MGGLSARTHIACDCPKSRLTKVSIAKKSKGRKNDKFNKVLSWGAGLSLFAAFLYGLVFNQPDFTGIIKQLLDTDQGNASSSTRIPKSRHIGRELR